MKPDKNKKGGPSRDHTSQPARTEARDGALNAARTSEEAGGPTKSYSRRKIVSNWDKYEEPTTSITYNESYEPEGEDFNKLLQMPSSADSHFKFKSDQLEPPPCGNLFALNLKTLASGLASIPFYEQVDIPKDTLSAAEVDAMDRLAKEAKPQEQFNVLDLLS